MSASLIGQEPPLVDTSRYRQERPEGDALGLYVWAQREHGTVVRVRHRHLDWVQVSHPSDLENIFKRSHREFRKGSRWNNFRLLVGQGLITVEPEHWLEQRRALQPSFLRRYHERFAARIACSVEETITDWRHKARGGKTIEVALEMSHLTLSNAGHILLGVDLNPRIGVISENLVGVLQYLNGWHLYSWHTRTFGRYLPRTRHGRFRRSMQILEAEVQAILQLRCSHHGPGDHNAGDDMLSKLLEGDEAAPPRSAAGRERTRYVRDQIMTFLFTGHETTSIAVSWVWYVLATHPEVEAQLHDELDRVLGGRLPSRDDLPHLPYLRQVVSETLRLYPPVWNFLRQTSQPELIGDYAIAAGTTLNILPYVTHRHPDFWGDPERFDPDRFAPEREALQHPYAYIPFGGGPRQCLGKHTALLEAQLIVAGLAQHFRLRLVEGIVVRPAPTLTLWPSHNLPMTLHPRRVTA